MEPVWYGILAALMGTYILLDGYDLGAGITYLFFADTEEEKRKVTNSISSMWDANEVWLMAFVGLAMAVFPKYTRVLFNNFGGYILLFFLFLLLKTLAYNLLTIYQNKPAAKRYLGYLFGFLNMMLVVFISLIFANILRGLHLEDTGRLRFVSQKFSPLTQKTGFFDWFTVLTSAMIFFGILIHGLGWVVLKNQGAFNRKLKKIIQRLSFFEFILIFLFLVSWYFIHPDVFHTYWTYPFFFVFPVLALISLFGLMGIRTYQGENKAFLLSTNLIIFSWLSVMVAIYPNFIMPLGKTALTAFNAGFDSPQRFYIEWWILVIGIMLLAYSIVVHKYMKGGLNK